MEPLHYAYWPDKVPRTYENPRTSLYYNLEISAKRFPSRTAVSYYGSRITYEQLKSEVDALAGFLQNKCGIEKGDKVILYMQNCPQFIIAYYAILRVDAVIVPTNPMNVSEEIRHYIEDSGASTVICGAELGKQIKPLLDSGDIKYVISAFYGNYVSKETDLPLPVFLHDESTATHIPGFLKWEDTIAEKCIPRPHESLHTDLAAIIYTSGTTGQPKGCMHTHSSLMFTAVFPSFWKNVTSEEVMFGVTPFFHVTGMQVLMNATIYAGAENVVMTRWDRELALLMIERHQVTNWTNIPTMVIDLFASPNFKDDSLKSLRYIGGGGATMPEAVAKRLQELCGLSYVEGYGLTETAAPTHCNHWSRPKKQCLGIPICNTEALIINPNSLEPLAPNETGEIVSRGPQVFTGYWNNPKATKESFVTINGKDFFRTGDLGYIDEDGYFFLVDRLKRMINASGYKVWPAEIESVMYRHEDIQESCIINVADPRRGETVKAVIVLKESARNRVSEEDIVNWCKERMAAYKYPRIVEFVDELPKSGSGKVQWRVLQEREAKQSHL